MKLHCVYIGSWKTVINNEATSPFLTIFKMLHIRKVKPRKPIFIFLI